MSQKHSYTVAEMVVDYAYPNIQTLLGMLWDLTIGYHHPQVSVLAFKSATLLAINKLTGILAMGIQPPLRKRMSTICNCRLIGILVLVKLGYLAKS